MLEDVNDNEECMVRHVRVYLRKGSPGEGLDLDTVTGWESQILWVLSMEWGAQGQCTTYLSHIKKVQEGAMYSEWNGLFLSSQETYKNLQRLLLPWDGMNHLWQCSLLSSDFGESPPGNHLLDVVFQIAKDCHREPHVEHLYLKTLLPQTCLQVKVIQITAF